MYVFGIDIPLVELLIGMGIIGVIILFEITILLMLITHHLKNSKKLESEIRRLSDSLIRLQEKELQGLIKIKSIQEVYDKKSLKNDFKRKEPELKPLKQPIKKKTETKKRPELFKKIDNLIRREK